MTLRERLAAGELLILDGAMGTEIQKMEIREEDWGGHHGCNEFLNISAPHLISEVHRLYYAAGSDIVETNTFGASEYVLAEYGLADRVREINSAAARLARSVADGFSDGKPRYVAGSIGPGTRLASLGQIDHDTVYAAYRPQLEGLAEGGVDIFMIETCQDPLHFKTVIEAAHDVIGETGRDIMILLSVTIETTGTMLVGSDIGAVISVASAMGVDILGINCATGPDLMAPYISEICQTFPGYVMVMPNAGMPQNIGGKMVYSLPPEEFGQRVARYVSENGVQIAGGCCGTSPAYIAALHAATRGVAPARRERVRTWSLASLYSAQGMLQEPRPLMIGERANTNGSRRFKELLTSENWDGILEVIADQETGGSHALDLCVAYTGRNEVRDMTLAIAQAVTRTRLPLVIDTTSVEVMEASLKLYGGRPLVNSVNLESGEAHAERVCRLAKRHGAALVALTIDEIEGMAKTAGKKLEVARRIHGIAVDRVGLAPQDLVFDVLTFTLGSGDQDSRNAGIETLEGIRQVKAALPGVWTVLGLSNISFGLAPQPRKILNSVFLAEAVAAGLDMAIVHAASILPVAAIDDEDREAALALIYNRHENALFDFIKRFEDRTGGTEAASESSASLPVEKRLEQAVLRGNRAGLDLMLDEARTSRDALSIINEILIPAMKIVGELFGSGKMQLPFVLQSAETMRAAVDLLQPWIEKKDASKPCSMVLATVRGDVHDIGKNLVDIILSNNGFKVYNLGIKCEIQTIIDKVREVEADAIGLSGLLVKSTVIMKEYLEALQGAGIDIPVFLGGAALTRQWADEDCQQVYGGTVVYSADAFDGLRGMTLVRDGGLDEAVAADRVRYADIRRRAAAHAAQRAAARTTSSEETAPLLRLEAVPQPPFYGSRTTGDISLDDVFSLLTESVLFRGRWGFRRGQLSREDFDALLEREARPELTRLKALVRERELFTPQVAWGYFPCQSEGESLIVYDEGKSEIGRLSFPRQRQAPGRSIPDYFLPRESGRFDVLPLQVVTIGPGADRYAHELYEAGRYREYLFFHGLAVESAEALAEFWHRQIRRDLGIDGEDGAGIEDFVVQRYRGSRYSFGYPACPDLAENSTLLRLVGADKIGVTESENFQMMPEQTTSAFIVHHPQAKYFTID